MDRAVRISVGLGMSVISSWNCCLCFEVFSLSLQELFPGYSNTREIFSILQLCCLGMLGTLLQMPSLQKDGCVWQGGEDAAVHPGPGLDLMPKQAKLLHRPTSE